MRDLGSFVAAETALAAPPLVPEIRLYLASEITPLWQATEARLAETGTPPPYWAFAWPGGQAIARHLLDQPALVAGRSEEHTSELQSQSNLGCRLLVEQKYTI